MAMNQRNPMQASTKTVSLILLVLVVICLTGWCMSDYYVATYSPVITGLIMRFVFGVILIIQILVCIAAWLQKSHRCIALIVLVVVFGLNLVEYEMPYHNVLILSGLRDRIMRGYGVESLRLFARDFDVMPPLAEYNDMLPIKMYRGKDLARTKLLGKYHFLGLYNGFGTNGPNFVCESDGVVIVWWGGRPQWGFKVSVDGKAIHAPNILDAKILRVSKDIYFEFENGD